MTKKVLITGGAGFIGSHLAEALIGQGKKVIVCDDFSTGTRENIHHLEKNPNFQLFQGSVLDEKFLEPLVRNADFVYHLAAAVGVETVVKKPLHSFLVNLKGTEAVLSFASKDGIPVLLASSSEIYGKNDSLPFSEQDDRVYGSVYNMRWGYAFSKGADEFLGLAYWQKHKMPVIIVRLFNVIGPRQTGTYGMVVPRFIEQAITNKPITIYGDGKQTRCFVDVKEVVEALLKLAECPEAVGQVVNLGSAREITIEELAKEVKRLTNSSSELTYVPFEVAYGKNFAEMIRRRPDLTKIKSLIGYEPRISLTNSIQTIIAAMQIHKA